MTGRKRHVWIARGMCGFVLMWAMAAVAAPQERQWVGEYKVAGQATPLMMQDRSAVKDAASTVDLPTMGARGVPLTSFSSTHGGVRFQLDGPRVASCFPGASATARSSVT